MKGLGRQGQQVSSDLQELIEWIKQNKITNKWMKELKFEEHFIC